VAGTLVSIALVLQSVSPSAWSSFDFDETVDNLQFRSAPTARAFWSNVNGNFNGNVNGNKQQPRELKQRQWQQRLAQPKSTEYYKALRIASVTKSQNEDYKLGGSNNNNNNKKKKRIMYIYRACCGLGHRLLRQASSYRWARDNGHPHLWVEWNKKLVPMCGLGRAPGELDLFEYFFGPGPMVLLHDETEADLDDYDRVLDLHVNMDVDVDVDVDVNVDVNVDVDVDAMNATTANKNALKEYFHRQLDAIDRQLERKTSDALATANANDYTYDTTRIQKGINLHTVQNMTGGWGRIELHKNGPPGYHKNCLARQTREQLLDQAILDDRFYRQLKASFLFNDRIEAFAKDHRFSERLVLGIHVRAGNGETGDFVKKHRGIEDIDSWVLRMAETMDRLIQEIQSAQQQQQDGAAVNNNNNNNTSSSSSSSSTNPSSLPPLLFVATDDGSVVGKLANATRPYGIHTTTLPQIRLEAGAGVTYFAKNFEHDQCKESWLSQIADSMLLGAADVVIAARYSSFSQSLPLVSVLSGSIRDRKRKRNQGDLVGAVGTDVDVGVDVDVDVDTNANTNTTGNNTGSAAADGANGNNETTNTTTTTNTTNNHPHYHHRFTRRLFCEGSRYGNGIRCYDDYLDWILSLNRLYVPSDAVFRDNAERAVNYRKEVMGLCEQK